MGTAVLASVMQSVTKDNMPKSSLKGQDPLAFGQKALDATLNGFHASFLLAAAFAVVALLITFLLHSGKINTPAKEDR